MYLLAVSILGHKDGNKRGVVDGNDGAIAIFLKIFSENLWIFPSTRHVETSRQFDSLRQR